MKYGLKLGRNVPYLTFLLLELGRSEAETKQWLVKAFKIKAPERCARLIESTLRDDGAFCIRMSTVRELIMRPIKSFP